MKLKVYVLQTAEQSEDSAGSSLKDALKGTGTVWGRTRARDWVRMRLGNYDP